MGNAGSESDCGKEKKTPNGLVGSLKSIFGIASEVTSCAANTDVGSFVTCFINTDRLKDFLKYIETEDKFYRFVRVLLPKIYIRICVRYITPIVVFVLMLGASTYGLYYNGILYQYEQYVMGIFDSIAESAVNNLICLIRRIRRITRFGVALKGSDGVTIYPVNYNLRDAYEQLHKDGLSVVDGLKDPVKIHFGAM